MTEAMTEAEAMIEAMTEALRGNDLNKAEEKRLKRNEQAKMMRERRNQRETEDICEKPSREIKEREVECDGK